MTATDLAAADLAPTGVLRAAINLGNPVLAQGTPDAPSGVTVDIARELASRLTLPVELICFGAAQGAFEARTRAEADICFLAVEPARQEAVAFTAPYAVIEAVFTVRADSQLIAPADVDRDGMRIAVNQGSAYDLFLSRTLKHATLERGSSGTVVFDQQRLQVVAGIRQPMADFAASRPDVRLLEPAFMQVQQALGTTRHRRPETITYLRSLVEELKANGSITRSLRSSGRRDAVVAPPAGRA